MKSFFLERMGKLEILGNVGERERGGVLRIFENPNKKNEMK